MHNRSTRQSISSAIAVSALFVISVPQQAQALSLVCCSSLEEMEQNSDLIIRGRALSDFDEADEVYFSQGEYQVHLASGNPLPVGTAVVIHDGKWQLVERIVTLSVEVLEVVEGETDSQTISVVQYNDWGAIPIKKGAEYLLFLSRSQPPEPVQNLYYNFYGQGTYNLDGADLRTSSALYYDADAVKTRYGDRIEFAPRSEKPSRIVPVVEERTERAWFDRLLSSIQKWFNDDGV